MRIARPGAEAMRRPRRNHTAAFKVTAHSGEPCPESGEWYSVNWEGKRMTLEKGEPMPGPEYSNTGAVIWHLQQEKK